jgi:hypothetical protein
MMNDRYGYVIQTKGKAALNPACGVDLSRRHVGSKPEGRSPKPLNVEPLNPEPYSLEPINTYQTTHNSQHTTHNSQQTTGISK